MAQRDPDDGRDFKLQQSMWLADALDRLPVAIALIDRQGRYIELNGALSSLFGSVIPSRDPEQRQRWQVFDESGGLVDSSNWPSERALRGERIMGGTDSVYMANTDQERRLRLFATPFVDAGGRSAGLVLIQDVDLDMHAVGQAFETLQKRFIETLVTTIRKATDGGSAAVAAQQIADRMGFTRLDLPRRGASLSPREEEVLRLLAWGNSRKEIGAQLGIAVKTVEFHRSGAARKLELKSRVDVVRYAVDQGWMMNDI
ncbi:MAG: LuxR C-terminal-related transcriptional regulator [Hyphomonadaceae bacterium]|nr:LuxR C-terminal-related transcriptional regulator [Hyphomonadaceae bacterium]